MNVMTDTRTVPPRPDLMPIEYDVTAERKAAFDAEGYVALRQVTGLDEVAIIRDRIQELFRNRAGHAEGMFFDFAGSDDEKQSDAMSLPQLLDVRIFAPEMLKTQFYRNAARIATQLLGPDAAFKFDHALLKPSGHGAATPWHQDDAFRHHDYDHTEISIWLALQDTDIANGCMSFLPGSHLHPLMPHRWVGGDSRIHALECHEGWDAAKLVPCPLSAGDVSIHTNRILHGAGPNMSDRPRMGYVLVFGLPAVKAAVPIQYPWLLNKAEPRLVRRHAWMRKGGVLIHGWRLISQIPQIGMRESVRRLLLKLPRPKQA